jgi:hypothetical protein
VQCSFMSRAVVERPSLYVRGVHKGRNPTRESKQIYPAKHIFPFLLGIF